MKLSRPFCFVIIVSFIVASYAAWKRPVSCSSEKKLSQQTLSTAVPSVSKNISLPQKKARLSSRSTLGAPAPLHEPSEEELNFFPGAVVVASSEIEGPEPHQKIEQRLLKTNFKSRSASSGFIRTEEIIDDQTGELLERREMLADHLIVSLPPQTTPEAFLEQCSAQISAIQKIDSDGSFYNVTLRAASLEAVPQALEACSTLEGVMAEPDFMKHLSSGTPNYFSSSYFLNDQWALWGDCGGINVYPAWQIQSGAPSIVVAVIDGGIRYTHQDLVENIWSDPAKKPEGCLHGIDMIDEEGTAMDVLGGKYSGHGTHCAGIIGGMGIARNYFEHGTFGIAPKVQLMDCRAFDPNGSTAEDLIIACYDYARRHGAVIMSCSFSGPSYSQAEFLALKKAQAAGIMVVAAAGNAKVSTDSWGNQLFQANNNDEHPVYPASYSLDNIISVANSLFSWASSCDLSPDSNYGPNSVHLAAPGDNIYSTFNTSDSSYEHLSGTSMAAPCVSGAIALLKEHCPQASYQALIRHLFANTDNVQKLQHQVMHGHLNIGRALQAPLKE